MYWNKGQGWWPCDPPKTETKRPTPEEDEIKALQKAYGILDGLRPGRETRRYAARHRIASSPKTPVSSSI
jgi:hypothetical protein